MASPTTNLQFRVIPTVVFGLLVFLMTPSIAGQLSDGKPFEFSDWEKAGVISSPAIVESSGLAASHQNAGMLWTHNDNGAHPGLFLIDKSGAHRATIQLAGVPFRDWEDICSFQNASDQRFYIALGDVGDNARRRNSYQIYVFQEPSIDLQPDTIVESTVTDFTTIDFVYPDGSHDCEAMAFDEQSKHFWLITKGFPSAGDRAGAASSVIYRLPWVAQSNKSPIRATRIGQYRGVLVTGMDISGNYAIVRNYLLARFYVREDRESWGETFLRAADEVLRLPLQRQGEAICFDTPVRSIWITSEATDQPIWKSGFDGGHKEKQNFDRR